MNHGLCFFHPNESLYNMYRRLLIANPAHRSNVKNLLPKRELIKQLKKSFEEFPDNPILKIPGACSPKDLTRFYDITLGCGYQCPECARLIFHTNLFNYSWIKQCPVHRKNLVDECPECGKKWPDSKGLDKNDCPCCGCSPSNSVYAERLLVQKEMEEKFNLLERVVRKFSDTPEYTIYMNAHRISRVSINATHKLVGAFLRSSGELDDSYAAILGLDSPMPDVKIRTFTAVKVERKDAEPAVDIFLRIRLAKMQEIVTFLRGLTSNGHILHEGCLYDYERSCPYCYAFGLWYKLIFFNSVNSLLKSISIDVVKPCNYLGGELWIELPEDIQILLYEKDLEMTFFAIYLGVLAWIRQENAHGSTGFIKLSLNENPFVRTCPRFEDFWFQERDGQVAFYYSDIPILTDANFTFSYSGKIECCFNKQEYVSPKIVGLYNSVWLLNIDEQILVNYKEPYLHLSPSFRSHVSKSKFLFERREIIEDIFG
jgi:hypothetical protein